MNRNVVLGVTGLRRTGKTVFLTALIHQLAELGSDGLDAFANHGVVLRAAGKVQSSEKLNGMPTFPYLTYLGNLREQRWPAATTDEKACALCCEFDEPLSGGYLRRVTSALGKIGLPTNQGQVTFHIHDYPGEYLFDGPLLSQTFAKWSSEALGRIGGQRLPAATHYCNLADQPVDIGTEVWMKSLRAAYAAYLVEARNAGLEYLQPAMSAAKYFARVEQAPAHLLPLLPHDEELPFVPLGQTAVQSGSPVVTEMETRFEEYRTIKVLPFVTTLKRVRKQIVLVDVLRVLRGGPAVFNDTSACLRAILECYKYGTTILGGTKKVLFAATKADHATNSRRPNLTRLLDVLVKKAEGAVPTGIKISPSVWMTEIRATEDKIAQSPEYGPYECVLGRMKDVPNGERAPVNPGVVPADWPDEKEWTEVPFPEFSPPELPSTDAKPWRHLGMDKLLWFAYAK